MSRAMACPRKYGRYGVCGAVLELTTIDGRLVERCPACERFARGLCLDCRLPVAGEVGKSRRCAAHTKAAQHAQRAIYRERNREAYNRRSKARMRMPDNQRRRSVNLQKWRKAHPDKVRQQRKRRELRQYQAERRVA